MLILLVDVIKGSPFLLITNFNYHEVSFEVIFAKMRLLTKSKTRVKGITFLATPGITFLATPRPREIRVCFRGSHDIIIA